ncbi:respiratory nitrate reductase subunit gamma [Maritalea porphyrae]|jgi:nitrate reductase gamma subunit|uniref:respiratory nitrate reductase subunit gamma n=1 Tax=Maritalea porphyrae TaxID=880732 RepID=UPI0022AE5C09|nr:respiratory nitrate reductase subunit gamma [Maritalea porphyrae]MCZ4273519.1 respiratory nitrate reductase subunit gamma [Maritalea porphyrae]
MKEFLNFAVFGVYPYIALATLVLGSVLRYDKDPYTWKAGSSQLLRRKQLVLGSVLFHVGVLVIFVGHLVGLLTPIWIFDALGISHSAKQMLAIVAGGIAGVAGIIGATLLIHRRFFDARVRASSSFSDNLTILILWVQLALGLATIPVSLKHLDGHEMVNFMNYCQGIFTFNFQASSYIIDASPIFKAHMFLGLTILLLFPFTRLVHMLSVPVRYMWRPGYQVVRSKKKRT